MNQDELLEIIENLNLDYINIKESNEYLSGLKSNNLKKYLCSFKLKIILNNLLMMIRLRKYNSAPNYELLDINNELDSNKKVVVYTCIAGDYDLLYDPLFINPNIDYIVFSTKDIKSKVWKNIIIPDEIKKKYNSDTIINRYYKMNPHVIFKDCNYDYAIYVDGNIQPISDPIKCLRRINDNYGLAFHYHSLRNCIYKEGKVCQISKKGNSKNIKSQLKKYRDAGVPEKYGMVECGIIAVDLKSEMSKNILEQWWNEFLATASYRDQLSLIYILWKNNIEVKQIATLGLNLFKNPIFRVNRVHKKGEVRNG